MLDEILIKSNKQILANNHKFRRYFIDKTDFSHRLIIVLGQRGIGKTTTLAQLASTHEDSLYLSLDDISYDISSIIDEFVLSGGTHLYLDEIHKNPQISAILKSAYDNHKNLKIIATGSSALQILKSSHDLSRRAVVYKMQGMSFREFLGLKYELNFASFSLDEITKNHSKIAKNIISSLQKEQIIPLFREYLKTGYYPYSNEVANEFVFFTMLKQTIEASIDSDLLSIYPNLNGNTARKLKILLNAVSNSVPFMPNYTNLKNLVGIKDDRTLKEYLAMLENADIIRLLMRDSVSLKSMEKAEKIYLENTNFMYIHSPQISNVRETFFVNQLSNLGEIYANANGDFKVGDMVFEVGGKDKGYTQIKDIKNSFIAADDIEIGVKNKIPLWLFGFLY